MGLGVCKVFVFELFMQKLGEGLNRAKKISKKC
jgi:hypothetical protein